MWIFPSGCYSLCATSGYSVTGPIIPFNHWTYYQGYPGIHSQGPGFVPPAVTFTSTGVYNLELDNGYCTALSGDMDITLFGCEGRPAGDALSVPSLSSGNAYMTLVPNPANESTRIDYHFSDNGRMHYVEVYDVTGRKLDSKLVGKAEGSWLLNLNNYTPGLYQVVLREGNQVLQQGRLSIIK